MLIREALEKRVAEMQANVEQSAGRHNMLVGHLAEAKFLLDLLNQQEIEDAPVVVEHEDTEIKKQSEELEHAVG